MDPDVPCAQAESSQSGDEDAACWPVVELRDMADMVSLGAHTAISGYSCDCSASKQHISWCHGSLVRIHQVEYAVEGHCRPDVDPMDAEADS